MGGKTISKQLRVRCGREQLEKENIGRSWKVGRLEIGVLCQSRANGHGVNDLEIS